MQQAKKQMRKEQIKETIPDDIHLSLWQQCLKKEIFRIEENHAKTPCPYGRGWEKAKYGCTQDVFCNGKAIMEASTPVFTYCCGVTLEIFLEAWKAFCVALAKKQKADHINFFLTPKDIKEIYRYFFVRDDIDKKYKSGAGGAIFTYLSGIQQRLPFHFCHIDSLPLVEFGDFVQIHNPKGREDHSILALGSTTWKNRPVILGFSSTSHYTDDQPSGPGYDWFYLDLPGRSFDIGYMENKDE